MIEVQSKTVKSVVDECNLVLKTGGQYLPSEQMEFQAFKNKGKLLANITVRNDAESATIISVSVDQLIQQLQGIKDTFARK